MTKKQDTFSAQTESPNALTAQELNTALDKVNPLNVDTADKARDLIEIAQRLSDKMQLFGYKALEKVYSEELWKEAIYYDEKGLKKSYVNYVEWAEKACGLKKSQAYAAVAIGALITPDGAHSIFYREEWGKNDFDFTALKTLYEAKTTTYEHYEEAKGAKLKKTCRKEFITMEKWDKVKDEDGAEVLRKVNGNICNVYTATPEKSAYYVDNLITFEVISPLMSVSELKKALSVHYVFTEYGAEVKDEKELTEDTTEDTTDTTDTTEDTTDTTEDTAEDYATALDMNMLKDALTVVINDIESGANDRAIELIKTIIAKL
jgi:hypothetical protein